MYFPHLSMQSMEDVLGSPLLYPITALIGVLVLAAGLYWHGMSSYRALKRMNIPVPTPLPFIGNMVQITKCGGIHKATTMFMQRYGKVYGLCIGLNPTIVIGDPEMLKQILVKDFHSFRNRFRMSKSRSTIMSHGMPNAEGEPWKRIRSTLTPTFTSGKLKMMTPLMMKSADKLVEKLGKVADTGKTVDILDWFSQMTLEVILATSFGVVADIQENPDHDLIAKARALFKLPAMFRYLAMVPFSSYLIGWFMKLQSPIQSFVNLAQEILQERSGKGGTGRKDLVDIMLTTTNPDGTRRLSDNEIVAQSVTFLLAGHDTSSNTLSASAYYLALNLDAQNKLRREIRSAIKSNPTAPALELAVGLEYLDCVVNEVLRLQPPGHTMNRECAEEYKINGITIPSGMEVTLPIYALHRDPDAWPEPDRFDPERFRGPAKDSRHPFQFLPFGAGPRNCIGMRFALQEVKLTLFKVLAKYKFVRCPQTQVPLELFAGATLIARDGIKLRVETA